MEPANQLTDFAAECKTFKQLLDSQTWVDCTLACDGGKISVHRVVLSACSSYLNKILVEHPVDHPIIILPELAIEDVRTLVHYMYTGELLQSDTQHSASLLRTAAVLSVNSLNDFLSSRDSSDSVLGESNTSNNNDHANIQDTMIGSNNTSSSNNNSISMMSNYSSNSSQNTSIGTSSSAGLASLTSSGSIVGPGRVCNIGDVYNANKAEFQFKCPVCQNHFQTICSFEYHMQRTHNVTSFGCEICHKPFASLRYVLTDHMRRCHGWKAEQKLQC